MFVGTVISRTSGAIEARFLNEIVELISVANGEKPKVVDLPHHGTHEAKKVLFEQYPDSLKQKLYNFSNDNPLDIVVQLMPNKRRLLVFDMDSTLIQAECIDLIAEYAGVGSKVSEVTEAAMRGEIDFAQSLAQRVALLKGVPVTVYEELKQRIPFTNGVRELTKALRSRGIKMAVLSGGFVPLAKWVQNELGLDYAFANILEDDGKALLGTTVGTVVDGNRKAELLKEIAQQENIDLEETMAVGDGSNDLAMMSVAGFGVAFNAKPLVQQKAPGRLNTGSLADLIYLLD